MYAIIESCGKQYKVAEGDVVFFEKLDTEEGKKVTFDKVVLLSDDGKVEVGAPYVKGIKVEGKVVAHGKGKKIIVFISTIQDSLLRQIVYSYCVAGMSWKETAKAIGGGNTADSVRKRFERSFPEK